MVSWRLTQLVSWLVSVLLQLNHGCFLCEIYNKTNGVSWYSSSDLVNFGFLIYHLVANSGRRNQECLSVHPNSGEAIYYLLLLCGNISINPSSI